MLATSSDPDCARCGRAKSTHRGLSHECPVDYSDVDVDARPIQLFCRGHADLPRLGVAPHPKIPLGSYVHTKSGKRYEVIGGVMYAYGDNDSILVLYQSVEHSFLAARPTWAFAAAFTPVAAPLPTATETSLALFGDRYPQPETAT